jgi:hypothetical protein
MTQHYLLPCSCGQKVRVANSQAGGQVACGCGNRLPVPTLRGLRELEIAPTDVPKRSRAGWSRLHGAFFATGLLAAAVGFVLITLFLWRYSQLVGLSTDRTDDVVQAESTQIDNFTAVQLLTAWSELVEQGLGEKQTPIWIAAKETIRGYLMWVSVGAGAIVAGILLSVATLFVGRPSV